MKVLSAATGIVLGLASLSAQAQIFKCVDGQGNVTFSQVPCPGQSNSTVKPQINKSPPPSERRQGGSALEQRFDGIRESVSRPSRRPQPATQDRSVCKDFSSTELRTMVLRNQVVPGMKAQDVLRAWGKPDRINGWQYVWWFNSNSGSYVYIEDGCVRSVDGAYRGSKFVR